MSTSGKPPLSPLNTECENIIIDFDCLGLSATTDMLQCVEREDREPKKVSIAGGRPPAAPPTPRAALGSGP